MDRSRGTRAGGAIVALSILVGAVVGVFMRQSSIGVLAGAAVGGVLLLLFWLIEQR